MKSEFFCIRCHWVALIGMTLTLVRKGSTNVRVAMCWPVILKRRYNIPPFPKAASDVGVNMWHDVKHEVEQWAVTMIFVFKLRPLHCTPLEFRTANLAGAFNVKVATIASLPLQQQVDNEDSYRDRGDANISPISVAIKLFILMSADEVMD